ncbi:DHX37 protein [Schizopora paradoxa]|uniref:RNA helicase n=1 Tax=Schizopora paradoxa TaxID=27342 RepID=A0A0H2RZ29_9AGAM|nr:DHX37 protein [Schizopora paradoxa]
MGHLRERYNAKGRQSSSGRAKKRVKHGASTTESTYDQAGSNEPIVLEVKSQEQKELDRRERLRLEVLEQQKNSKLTSKKKKQLEKYIDKKLKKEERVQIFEKLAQTQLQLPSTLLQPSSTLGSRKVLTNQELQENAESKLVKRALDGRVGGKRRRGAQGHEDEVTESDASDDDLPVPDGSRESPVVIPNDDFSTSEIVKDGPVIREIGVVGSALRRNADGTVPAPTHVKKQKKTTFKRWGKEVNIRENTDAHESDSSFDSSDSAYDESEDEQAEEEASEGGSEAEGSEEEDEPAVAEVENDDSQSRKRKRGGFKQWAMQQLSAAKEYVPPTEPEDVPMTVLSDMMKQANPSIAALMAADREKAKNDDMRGPLGERLDLPTNALAQQVTNKESENSSPKKFVNIERSPDVQEARLQLPILAEEQTIVEAIRLNPVIVICGETGSGKTTQVPQFLYEAGFGHKDSENPGMIGITQPRRVAAMSMAQRVAQELSLPSSVVSHQIRYDATTAPTTAIKFMTDGVLLRELSSDFSLSKYSVIIVDEAHERSINTDILIGVLSRVIKLREEMWKEGKGSFKPLRLIIMSATLRVSDFVSNTTLFPSPPPVIKVDARQYPVTVHFNRRTSPDYISEAIKKVSKIHARLPAGGILVFLTGQNEISGVCKKLEAKYGVKALAAKKHRRKAMSTRDNDGVTSEEKCQRIGASLADVEIEEIEFGDSQRQDSQVDDEGPVEVDHEALDSEDDSDNDELGIDKEESEVPMHILPLYSLLPTDQQMRVFQPPPSGSRLVIVSTNVAETSLTIPGIRYVVDCGRAKERTYDITTGVQSFHVNWISKASANQRAGRAGRTGPGHCYRLFSSALYEHHFDQHAKPEILQMPIEGIVLQMKSMHIDTVTNFPFPTPPDRTSLRKAEHLLIHLGALRADTSPSLAIGGMASASLDGQITDLGKAMSLFPLAPRFAKMLVGGRQHGCLPYVIAIVAALTVGDPFLREEALHANEETGGGDDEELLDDELDANRKRRRAFFESQAMHSQLGKGSSDVFRYLSVVGAYEFAGGGRTFCQEHFVRPKAMEEIHKLRSQISNIVSSNFPGCDAGFRQNLEPPSDQQTKVLRQLICSAFLDQVAVRKDIVEKTNFSGTRFKTCRDVPYRVLGVSEDAYIHPSSTLFDSSPPDFLIYQESTQRDQLRLKTLTVINPVWLSTLGKSLCTFSKPQKNASGVLMVIPRFGDQSWELPAVRAPSQ